jgi:hypothetical protein
MTIKCVLIQKTKYDKMKQKIIILTSILLCNIASFGQTSDWIWAKSAGGNYFDYTNTVITDSVGNIYIVGIYSSPTMTFGNITLTNVGSANDFFITKYDPSGNVIWAQRGGGNNSDVISGATIDNQGNIYITGYSNSDTLILGNDTLLNAGITDFFIVKYDSSGVIKWARNCGSNKYDLSYYITADILGNVYITGLFSSDTLIIGSDTLIKDALDDVFIAKYDSSGNVIWAKSAGGNKDDIGSCISTDSYANVFVSGYFISDSISFGNTTLYNTEGTGWDIFIAKYDSNGNLIWAKDEGGSGGGDVDCLNIKTDNNNDFYITGLLSSSAIILDTIILSGSGSWDFFIAKFDNNSNIIWAKSGGGSYNTTYRPSVTIDKSNNVILSFSFESTDIIFEDDTIVNEGLSNLCIIKFDSSGNLIWIKKTGGDGAPYNRCITNDNDNNIYVTGYFRNYTATIGSTLLTNIDTSGYSSDIFITKVNAATGITESLSNIEISFFVFPNPTDKDFTIMFPPETKQIQILNSIGQIVQKTIVDKQMNYNFTLQNSGLYFIQITTDKQTVTKKLIVTK